MSKILTIALACVFFAFLIGSVTTGCGSKTGDNSKTAQEYEATSDKYDGPDKAIAFEVERTRDLSTGKVPWEKLLVAMEQTEVSKSNAVNRIEALAWAERGPDGDFNGPSANSRPNMDQTSGRVRAVMVDSLDPSRKTVFIGSVSGGLWKTTDITTAPSNWVLVNDQMANLAIADICQDPRPGFQNIMYCCTGESYSNIDAVRGAGVFKSVDGGNSWNFLSNTTSYVACTRILCDYLGNIYLGTRSSGLLRSSDGGANWNSITPAGLNSDICDMEISSTAAAGRLHVCTGIGTTQGYRYTDAPSTITSSGWTAPTTTFVSGSARAEIAVMGNVLYALPVNSSDQVTSIYKSIDGGDNWAVTGGQPSPASWVNQGWYCVTVAINPSNPDECIVGGLDCHKTTNGGTSWIKISTWASTTGQYVHADQHDIQWWDGGSKLLFASDGGMHFSSNGGTTIRDRNKGLRIKQFYSVAIHPTITNYFLAGAQDNGVHRLHHPGLDSSIEVTGGDGAYVAIDQDEGQFQFGSYVYNVYRRSTNGGGSWSTPVNITTSGIGRFINPWDYDNTGNKLYACYNANNYLRWNDPQTGSSTQAVAMPAFAGGNVSAVHVSPYTANRVFFGTGIGGIIQVDHAEGSTPTGTMINSGAGMSGYINCVATGSDEQHLIACMTNYNLTNNIWVTSNGGTTWTGIEGNLPNMPVRWAMFHPDTDTKVFIATETGVWETDLINGSSTIWTANSSFPNVRTDMIKYRAADRTIAAGTHGRGIWTATIPVVPGFSFTTPAPATASCPVPATMSVTLGTNSIGGFGNLVTLSAISGVPAGTTVTFGTNPVAPGLSSVVTLNNTNTLAAGTYTITIQGLASGAATRTTNIVFEINAGSGPVINTQPLSQAVCEGSNVSFSVDATGTYQWQISTNNGSTWTNIGSAMASTYSLTSVTISLNANQYRCVLTNSCGSINSNAAVLTVSAIPAMPVITAGGPLSLCIGANVVLTSSSASGNQWYKDAVAISGETNQTYTATTAGSYTVIVTASGCISPTSLATVVTVSATPAIPTISWNGSQLSTAAGFTTYQWFLNNIAISGATAANHSPVLSGLYKVRITNAGGCSATSSDFNLVATAVNNLTLNGVQYTLSPNPANDVINIKVNGNNPGKVQLRMISITGAEMMRINNISNSATLLVSNYPAGIYFILLNGKTEKGTFKVIINH